MRSNGMKITIDTAVDSQRELLAARNILNQLLEGSAQQQQPQELAQPEPSQDGLFDMFDASGTTTDIERNDDERDDGAAQPQLFTYD